jgi:enoyl-CoA hydratase/carnithine racemase
MFLLGEPFTATRALELGLVTRVVPDGELFATAKATAQKLVANPDSALLACNRLIKQASMGQLKDAMKSETEVFMEQVVSAEAKEALSAFLENRPPDFTKSLTHVGRPNSPYS